MPDLPLRICESFQNAFGVQTLNQLMNLKCPNDPGGYFIISGVILIHKRNSIEARVFD